MKNLPTSTELSQLEQDSIKNICVILWGLLGDVLIRVSLIESLKQHFPDSKLTVIVDPSSRFSIESHPDIDEIVTISRKKKPILSYLYNFFKKAMYLRGKKFDLCVDLYAGGSSPLLTRLVKAKFRLGMNHKKALRKANNLLVNHPDMCGNWTQALGTILRPLGITKVRRGTSYHCSAETIAFAKEWLREIPGESIVVNLGAGAKEKMWPILRFVELLTKIQKEFKFHPVVLSNPGQSYLLDEFRTEAGDRLNYSVFPQKSFMHDAALIQCSRLIISGNTSILNLAFAVKCPALGLFIYTRPEPVSPEDCIHVACFEPGQELDECGMPNGSPDLSVDTCYKNFLEIMRLIDV